MHSSALLIKPKISVFLCLFFCLAYGLSFFVLLLASMPLWLHFFGGLFLIIQGLYVMHRHVFYRHPLSVRRLWCDENAHWRVQCRDTRIRSLELIQSVVLSRYFILLTFRVPGRFFPMLIPLALDSDSPETLRVLRYILSLQSSAKSQHVGWADRPNR